MKIINIHLEFGKNRNKVMNGSEDGEMIEIPIDTQTSNKLKKLFLNDEN